MNAPRQDLSELLELANLYPSPHNGQPIRLKHHSGNSYDLYFDRSRGLQSTDISLLFSFVSMGVFIQHLDLCAQAYGHGFSYELSLPGQNELRGSGTVQFAHCTFQWHAAPPDSKLQATLRFRQTSRKKYYEGAGKALDNAMRHTASNPMTLQKLTDPQARQAIWLNQRAVFDDMFIEPVRRELDHWLRYTKKQKYMMRDGLAFDCMEINGPLMKTIVSHPQLLKWPGLSGLIRKYYIRTMADESDVYYMLAPFASELDAFTVGLAIMKTWKLVAEYGRYLHPFGTIMSNHAAHRSFLSLAGIDRESQDDAYLVFIFRCGKSKSPHASLRLPVDQHLLWSSHA